MPGGDAVSPALGVLGRNQQRRRTGHLLSASAKLAPVGSWWRCSIHVTFAKHRPPLRVSQSRSGHCGEQSTNNPSGSSAVGLSSLFVVCLKCHDLSAQEAAMADPKRGWNFLLVWWLPILSFIAASLLGEKISLERERETTALLPELTGLGGMCDQGSAQRTR